MDVKEYNKLSNAQHGPWTVPEEFFDEQGQFDPDLMIQILEGLGYIAYDLKGSMILKPRLLFELPEVHKLLSTILGDAEQAQIDELVDAGILNLCITSAGKAVYTYTEDGAELMNKYRKEA